jgi:hypothetical protein
VSAGFGTKVKELDFERGNSKAAVKEPNSEPDNSKPALFAKSAKGAAPRTATPKRKRTSAARLTYNQGKRFAESVGHPPEFRTRQFKTRTLCKERKGCGTPNYNTQKKENISCKADLRSRKPMSRKPWPPAASRLKAPGRKRRERHPVRVGSGQGGATFNPMRREGEAGR